jgi:hypothetical protein
VYKRQIYTLRGVGVIPEVIWIAISPKAVPFQEIIFSIVSLFIGVTYIAGIKTGKERLVVGIEK